MRHRPRQLRCRLARGTYLAAYEITMKQWQGIAVAPGVAIAEALVLSSEGFRIPRHMVAHDALEDELSRWDAALASATEELACYRDEVTAELGQQCGGIFSAHLQMLRD